MSLGWKIFGIYCFVLTCMHKIKPMLFEPPGYKLASLEKPAFFKYQIPNWGIPWNSTMSRRLFDVPIRSVDVNYPAKLHTSHYLPLNK